MVPSSQKRYVQWELWDGIKTNSKAYVQNEINLHRPIKKVIMQVGAKMMHIQAKTFIRFMIIQI